MARLMTVGDLIAQLLELSDAMGEDTPVYYAVPHTKEECYDVECQSEARILAVIDGEHGINLLGLPAYADGVLDTSALEDFQEFLEDNEGSTLPDPPAAYWTM